MNKPRILYQFFDFLIFSFRGQCLNTVSLKAEKIFNFQLKH